MRRLVVLMAGLAVMGATACTGEGPSDPPEVAPVAGVPAQVEVAGSTLSLETYIWRDFMPVSPPDGKPLIAVLRVRTAAGPFPAGVVADQVTITYQGDAWTAPVAQEQPSASPGTLELVARDGPKWGPNVDVDVVVRLRDAQGRTYLLGAAAQPVHRTS